MAATEIGTAVKVRRGGLRRSSPNHPHVTVVSAAGSVTLGATDEKVQIDGLGSEWAQIPRPGTNALARRAGRKRMTMKLTAMLTHGMGGKSVNEQMLTLDAICASSSSCGVSYAEAATHRWLLTEVTVESVDRQPMTNRINHANATLTFLVAVDEFLYVSPSRTKTPPSDKGKANKRKSVVVRKGDTLAKIASRVYGNASRWPEIAKLNKIRNPKSIKVGQKLKV